MIDFKIRVNPSTKEVDYTVEGSYEDLLKVNFDTIKEMNILIQKIKETFPEEEIHDVPKAITNIPKENSDLQISVPTDLIDTIEKMDERSKIPLLWYYSSKPIMTVSEFLEMSSDTGFSLSSNWHPSAGGHFASTLVSQDKMFREKGKKGREKLWELTDVGKLKMKALIKKIVESKKQTDANHN